MPKALLYEYVVAISITDANRINSSTNAVPGLRTAMSEINWNMVAHNMHNATRQTSRLLCGHNIQNRNSAKT
jgi:uncharacterized cupin superfamily protein